jgi:hypothetical protein
LVAGLPAFTYASATGANVNIFPAEVGVLVGVFVAVLVARGVALAVGVGSGAPNSRLTLAVLVAWRTLR